MRTQRAWLPWLAATAVGAPLLIVTACFGLHAWSARGLPDTIPAAAYRPPETVRAQFLAIETDGATRMGRVNPVTFWIATIHGAARDRPDPELRLLLRAAEHAKRRHWRGGRMSEWHLASIAYTVDVGRRWTFDQAVATLLAESDFGRCSVGIEAAARAYFGVSAAELRPQESLALIALLRGPSRYDLDVDRGRERFRERFAESAETLGQTGPEWTAEAALARLRPAACVRGGRRDRAGT